MEMRTLEAASRAQRLHELTQFIESFESQVSRLPRFNRTVNKNSRYQTVSSRKCHRYLTRLFRATGSSVPGVSLKQ